MRCESVTGKWLELQEEYAGHTITVKDFRAVFDASIGQWSGTGKGDPSTLKITVSCYQRTLKGDSKSKFKGEVDRWIKEGILCP